MLGFLLKLCHLYMNGKNILVTVTTTKHENNTSSRLCQYKRLVYYGNIDPILSLSLLTKLLFETNCEGNVMLKCLTIKGILLPVQLI